MSNTKITPELIQLYVKFLRTLETARQTVSETGLDFHFIVNTLGYDLTIEKTASVEEIIDEMVQIFNSKSESAHRIQNFYYYHSAVTPNGKELRTPPSPGHPDSWIENGVNYIIDRISDEFINASASLEINSHNVLFMTPFQERRFNLTWGSYGRKGNLSRIDLPICLMSNDHLTAVISNCHTYAERTIFFTMCEELHFRKNEFISTFDEFLYDILRQAVDREIKTINVSREKYTADLPLVQALISSVISLVDRCETKESVLTTISLSISLYLNLHGKDFGVSPKKELIEYCIEITRKYKM